MFVSGQVCVCVCVCAERDCLVCVTIMIDYVKNVITATELILGYHNCSGVGTPEKAICRNVVKRL